MRQFSDDDFESAAESYADPAETGCGNADLALLIDRWPDLSESIRRALCALAELNPETESADRARLGNEIVELAKTAGL